MADFALSVSDLIMVEGFAKAFAKADDVAIHQFLYQNGMDIHKEIELVKCTHRNLQNKVVDGERYEGFERLDEHWIKSGYASLEARIEATEDASLRHTLRTMSVQRNQEAVFDN